MRIVLLMAGCAFVLGTAAVIPHAQASEAGTMVLAQNDNSKRGFFGLFGGSSKNKAKASKPVYVGGQNVGGEGGSAGRSGSVAVGKALGSSSASSAQQRASLQAKQALYDIPPSQPVDAVAAAEERLLAAQRRGAALREQWNAEFAALEAQAAAEMAANGGVSAGEWQGQAQTQTQTQDGTQTRAIYRQNSDSGRKPIRLFSVE